MLDIGLISVQPGLPSIKHAEAKNIIFSNKGGVAEQFVGQQLRACLARLESGQLFYWKRTGGKHLGKNDPG